MRPDLGFMISPNMGQVPLHGLPWAYDNGAFSGRFEHNRWVRRLNRCSAYRSDCLFVVAPDVVGDAVATWERSAPYLPLIRSMGYPAAYVAQDGIGEPIAWDAFDALFVGGSTAFKLSEAAYALVAEANARGKWTHMGRVNGWHRIKAAAVSGYGSTDGTKIAFGADYNLPRVLHWLDTLNRQAVLL